jgi:hypothetical protein
MVLPLSFFKALLKPGMNLNVETFHGTSLQGFGYDQKSFSYIKSATPFLIIEKTWCEYHFRPVIYLVNE